MMEDGGWRSARNAVFFSILHLPFSFQSAPGTSQSGYAHGHFMEVAPLQAGLGVVFTTKAAK
jgi:hypothetical protein